MRLFLYYSLHSFKNQLRKLFKTWVMVFILICMVLGGAIGFGAAAISDLLEDEESGIAVEDFEDDEEDGDAAASDDEEDYSEDEDWEDEIGFAAFEDMETSDYVEFVAGLIILIVFFFGAFSADKSGSKIFLPADVNILFASPMKPQSVLLFRLMTQLGMILLASIYLLIQLPNLIIELGLSVWGALSLVLAWCLAIMLENLFQLLLYMVCSTNPRFKERLRPLLFLLIALILGGCLLYWQNTEWNGMTAVVHYFNAKATRWIPLWGWLKALCVYAIENNVTGVLICLAANAAGMAVLIYVIWHIKADFYEDALQKTEELAELLAQAQSDQSSGIVFAKRKKDRSEKLQRDGMKYGWGANIFFFKSIYNRFRFAHLGFLTKTSDTYLVAALAVRAFCRFALELDEGGLVPVVMVLGVFVFFRTLGNPLEEDTKMDFFRLIPENSWSKMFWSLMGGTANCLLDLLPAVIVADILLGVNPLIALAWIPFLVSIDFYATNVGVFINLSVPVSAGKTVKQLIQILFIYFGLLPDIALLAIFAVTVNIGIGAVAAAVVNFGLGFLFFAFSPIFLEPRGGTSR